MAIHTWRRHHGDALTAHVVEKGLRSYGVAVWHESAGIVRELPKTIQRLESAKAAADDLLRRTFAHTCTIELCGEWLVWTA